jgi:2-polyprenyl-6-hydroxyphenyl methylase/3-demethylubiquinone-9 3-methyltransferase
MSRISSENSEFDHFSNISDQWWKTKGKFEILHQIMPIRMEYILKNIRINKSKNYEILDLGCGGGLTCEPLARLGAKVTGIDFIKENIEVAKKHAIKSKLVINYKLDNLENFKDKKKYDTILMLEVLEHLDRWEELIQKIKYSLKPKGKIIISTINKNQLANFFGIFVAENILNWIPKNTHSYKKLIKPDELKKVLLSNKFIIKNLEGMNYNPLNREWSLNTNIYPINYFCTAELV